MVRTLEELLEQYCIVSKAQNIYIWVMSEPVKAYTVTQYCTSLKKLLQQKIPPIWVRGVISQLNKRGQVVYITISDYEVGDNKPKASLSIYMFKNQFDAMNMRLAQEVKPFELAVDLKVSLQLEADFYIPQGKFQPRILDIDPTYTIGELAITKKLILDKLKKEGLLNKNKQIPFPILPIKIGLITATNSAAFNDFNEILRQSHFSFDVININAKMQGVETERTVLKALDELSTTDVDVVCIIRGGGSKTDLVYFDSEALCRAVANYSIPVISGIGHEIDHSLVDEVAWENKITPTACARFLVSCLEQQWTHLTSIKDLLSTRWKQDFSHQQQNCANIIKLIQSTVPAKLSREKERLERNKVGLIRGTQKLFKIHSGEFFEKQIRLKMSWKNFYQRHLFQLQDILRRCKEKSLSCIKAKSEQWDRHSRLLQSKSPWIYKQELPVLENLKNRLIASWSTTLNKQKSEVQLKQKIIRSNDPKVNLKKGYTITRVLDRQNKGKISKFTETQIGDKVVTVFDGGEIMSNVESIEKN